MAEAFNDQRHPYYIGHQLTREELPDAEGYLYTKEYFHREPLYTKNGLGYEFIVDHATMIFIPKISQCSLQSRTKVTLAQVFLYVSPPCVCS